MRFHSRIHSRRVTPRIQYTMSVERAAKPDTSGTSRNKYYLILELCVAVLLLQVRNFSSAQWLFRRAAYSMTTCLTFFR